MLYNSTIISFIEVLLVVVPVLLTVAFVTIAERKTMASMQRRLGPNIVGYYGLLQAFADALKLILKEYVSPTQANLILFFLGPIITLVFSLLGYLVIPYGPGLSLFDFNLGILYMLAVSSLATYGILLAGWSANSKYAFLGSLRSTAQLISYELILSSAILLVILLTGSLSLTVNIEVQKPILYIVPLFPVFIIFFIGSIAETNRAPFDLAEAESELVSGFMTEHAAVIFVFFFLAEYASIVLICVLSSVLFVGGYLNAPFLVFLFNYLEFLFFVVTDCFFFIVKFVTVLTIGILYTDYKTIIEISKSTFINVTEAVPINYYNYLYVSNSDFTIMPDGYLFEGTLSGLSLGLKTCIMIFFFIWARASLPRIRFDQLMSFCWTVLLPIVIAFIVLVPCILFSFEIMPNNILLL